MASLRRVLVEVVRDELRRKKIQFRNVQSSGGIYRIIIRQRMLQHWISIGKSIEIRTDFGKQVLACTEIDYSNPNFGDNIQSFINKFGFLNNICDKKNPNYLELSKSHGVLIMRDPDGGIRYFVKADTNGIIIYDACGRALIS